jgi:hypothetical protein
MNAGTWEHPLSNIKHFFTAPALRVPALVPMPGFGAFSRSVLDFESSARFGISFGTYLSGGKAVWTKFPRFVDNRRSGMKLRLWYFCSSLLKKSEVFRAYVAFQISTK